MGNRRPKLPSDIEQAVLVKSARRCCLCYGLSGDCLEKKGQIAHLDGDNSNNKPDNLAYLCFDHHDSYDSTTSQSKNYTLTEAKHYRSKLYTKVARGLHFLATGSKPAGGFEVVDLDFMESRNERRKPESHSAYWFYKSIPGSLEAFQEWAADPHPKAGELPVLDVKLRNTTNEIVFLKKAVFHIQRIWPIAPFYLCFSEIIVSANYDVLFPKQIPPYTIEAKLSQSVPSNGVDRFTLTLRPEAFAQIFLASLELIYDADNKVIEAGDILFALLDYDHEFQTKPDDQMSQETDENLKAKYILNNTAKAELQKVNAIRSNVVRAFEAGVL